LTPNRLWQRAIAATVNGITYNAPAGAAGALADGGTTRVPFLGANSFQLPRTVNVDLRIAREFKIWESWKLTLSGDAFNLFNHVNVTGENAQMFAIQTSGTLKNGNCCLLGGCTLPCLPGPRNNGQPFDEPIPYSNVVQQYLDCTAPNPGWHPPRFLAPPARPSHGRPESSGRPIVLALSKAWGILRFPLRLAAR